MSRSDSRDEQPEISVERACEVLGLQLSAGQFDQLARYRDLLIEANKRLNMTAITTSRGVDSRLIAESLALIPLIEHESPRILDIGTGGGVPGLPLAIALPNASFCLLDSTAKKLAALSEIAIEIGVGNVRFLHGRAEEIAHQRGQRGCYTHVTARAVARLPSLVELALPFLHEGGIALFPKGRQVQDEVHDATTAIATLGGRLIDIVESPVSQVRIVRIRQARVAPHEYPRKPGIPTRQPIGVPAR